MKLNLTTKLLDVDGTIAVFPARDKEPAREATLKDLLFALGRYAMVPDIKESWILQDLCLKAVSSDSLDLDKRQESVLVKVIRENKGGANAPSVLTGSSQFQFLKALGFEEKDL